jgi:hypothetical protein
LGEKGGALRKFAVVLKSETWPQVYDAKKKGPTPFGSNLHKAYGQSLVSYMGLYHIDERQKTLLCELLNGIFGKKGTIFTGTSVGWIPETVETLYFILLDTFLIYELRYGEFAHTYNARLLGNLIDVVQLFLVHHLTRFYESLVEAVQAQETANANPFGGTEATERVGVPVFDDSHE